MLNRHGLLPLVPILWGIVCSSGCQQFNDIMVTRWRQNDVASRMPFTGGNVSPEPVTPKQRADVQMAVAQSVEQQGQTDEAIRLYQDVLKKDANRPDACHRLGLLSLKKGDVAAAEKYCRQAMKRDPKNAELHCDLGYCCYLQRRWQEAESSLQRAIALKPDLPRAHNNLGLLYARTGAYPKAIEEFRRAGGSEDVAQNNLAYALMLQHRWAEAQEHFQLALASNPQSKATLTGLETLRTVSTQSQSIAGPQFR